MDWTLNWAPPLDIEKVKGRVKRYLDYLNQGLRDEQVKHSLLSARFGPVLGDPCEYGDQCLREKNTDSEESSVVDDSDSEESSVVDDTIDADLNRQLNLQSLPLDLYFELARHLRPIDLLTLARTSKVLRAFLLAKRNRQVWRIALYAVPLLPPCPEDMSEPLYSALLFDNHCWACGDDEAHSVDYFLRLRLCSWCFDEEVAPSRKLHDIPDAVRDVVTMSLPCHMQKRTFYPHDKTDVSPLSHTFEDYFSMPELHLMLERLSSPEMPPEQLEAYLVERATYVYQRHVGAVDLYRWEMLIRWFGTGGYQRDHARDYTWSPIRNEDGSCEPLKKSTEFMSLEETELWLIPLLNVKSVSDIEREGSYRDSRVMDAFLGRHQKRKAMLSAWAERMFASHPSFRNVNPDVLPNKAHLGDLLAYHAGKDEARCSLDALLALEHPEDTDEGLELMESLIHWVKDYLRRGPATAAMQVCRKVGTVWWWIGFGREEVDEFMSLGRKKIFSILENPDALFACGECSGDEELYRPHPWKEVHVHFRKAHPDVPGLEETPPSASCQMINTRIRLWSRATLGRDIVTHVGLGKDATITSLNKLVASGRLTCTCGTLEAPTDSSLDWAAFVFHVCRHLHWRTLIKLLPETPVSGSSSRPATCEPSSEMQSGVVVTVTGEPSNDAGCAN